MDPLENMDGLNVGEDKRIDPFEKLALMMMQAPQLWLPLFAGMGLVKALDKTSKPHRSNTELAQQGFDVGNPGQTGLPSEEQMTREFMQVPNAPHQVGFR